MKKELFRLFLLEDDDNDAFLIRRALERECERECAPCEITRFENPTEAIRVMEGMTELEVPDVIISDLKMPRMSGLEFLEWLRKSRFACIPVVILSGSSLSEDILRAYRQGANSFTSKPVEVRDLEGIVATVLKYWRDASHTPAAMARRGTSLCQ